MFLPSAVAQKRTAELGKCRFFLNWDDYRVPVRGSMVQSKGLKWTKYMFFHDFDDLQFLDWMNFLIYPGRASYDLVLDWFRGIIID